VPRGSDLIGLPVLATPSLKRLGRVAEVLLSDDAARICGLVLVEGDWLHPRRVLDYRAVKAVGPTHLLTAERYLNDELHTRCCRELLGLPVLDTSGEELGVLDDVQFETDDGRVVRLQLSRGLVDDLLNGKAMVRMAGRVTTGEAAILFDGPGTLSGGALH